MPLLFLLSANFIFYITFVQFGLLRMVNSRFGLSIESLGLPLGLMALTGAISSIATGYMIDRASITLRKLFIIACILSVIEGFVAISAIMIYDRDHLIPLFISLGLLMGVNGVIVIRLVETWPLAKRGLMAGYAMAVVYLAANLMAGFIDMPERIALINGIAMVITGALCITSRSEVRASADAAKINIRYLNAVIFLAFLVAVDSFIFQMEINMKDLYRYTWEDRWLWNGVVHAIAAIVAGILWDRKGSRSVIITSLLALTASIFILIILPIGPFTGFVSTILYNTAVSFYGIMMLIVWFYAASDMGLGLRTGMGMAFAGWIASPLGIALAMKALSVAE